MNNSKKYTVGFKGLNLTEGWQDGDLIDCYNLSAERYPCISQRAARTVEASYITPECLHAKEGIMVIDGTRVLFNNHLVGTVSAGHHETATIGNYIVIFPDKKALNVETGVFSDMEATLTATGAEFTANSITITGDVTGIRQNDAVTISGCVVAPENNKTLVVRGIENHKLTFYDNSFTAATEAATITIKRDVPDLEHICESNYRLWGTKGNTIYSSKFSDPFNFNVFDGLASDSYYIEVGSDGDFTGCIPYSSHICFFKENTLHKLYGSKPSNFQVVTSSVYGVQAGCERSLCIVNEQLLYKGVEGVYSYTGGVPELISSNFGTKRFSSAAAACDGERYYISMRSGDEWGLYVYDVLRNMWLKEDETHAVDLALWDGDIYYLDADDKCMYRIDRTADHKDVEWSATFCPFNETMHETKGYSKFFFRVELAAGAWIKVDVKTDRDTQWQQVYSGHNERAKIVNIPVVPKWCDSVSIRIHGKGECIVRTFVREFSVGGEC